MDLKRIAEMIIDTARKAGADDSDVVISSSNRTNIRVRLGQIEELKHASPKSLGVRIFKNGRNALSYTSDFRDASLKKLVNDTVEMAGITAQDKLSGLPEQNLLGKAAIRLTLYDKKLDTLSTDEKIRQTKELETIGMAQDKSITNSDGASWGDSQSQFVLANSRGFFGEENYTSCTINLSLIAEQGGIKQRDYWSSSNRFYNQLESIESVAKKAAERTVRKLGARKPKTQEVPVVFDPTAGEDLLAILASTVVGDAIYQKNSFLVDQLHQVIATKELSVIDDGLLPGGLASRHFDDEGLPSRKNPVIQQGVLQNYLCDCYSARKLNLPPTASASRSTSSKPSPSTTNFYMEKGPFSPAEIIASVTNGLYLTYVHWVGINYITGDYSRGAEGLWIENGKLSYPVQEFTIAGNVKDMLKHISMIGNDLEFRDTRNAPTFKIDSMTISGS
jgi:PmbA protein